VLGASSLTIFNMTQKGVIPLSDNEQLDILADAISDVGYWSWWTEQLPDIFQIEFGGTQLYFNPTSSDLPPQTQIALQFKYPSSVNFISKSKDTDNFQWTQDLHEDKIEPLSCSHGEFSFNNCDLTKSLLQQTTNFKTVYGNKPTTDSISFAPISLVFWCGDIGFAIIAKELKLLNHTGDIPLADISELNEKWWKYWRTYWDKRDTNEPMPKDYACDVTIPLKS
jgi:hypothetical protein